MKVFKAILIILFSILIILLAIFSFMCYNVYNQAKMKTIPQVKTESYEGYETNIINSLLNKRALEIPPEMLSGMVSEKTEQDILFTVSENNELEIWFKNEVPVIGECDMMVKTKINSYSKDTGVLKMDIVDIYCGTYKIPSILYGTAFKQNDYKNIDLASKTFEFEIDKISIEVLTFDIEIGIDKVKIEDGKVYFGIYADIELDIFAED